MSGLDYAVIVAYFAIIFGVAIFVSRKKSITSKDDFLLAGRSLNLPMFVAGLASVTIGGASVTTSAQLGFTTGVAAIWLGGTAGIGIFLLSFLMKSRLSKMHIYTTNEVLGVFYGPGAKYMSALVSFVYLALIGVLQVMAIGTALSTMLGLNYITGMVVGACVIVIYLILGGMWAVAYTDFFQFCVMAVGCMIIGPICAMNGIGGISNIAILDSSYFDFGAVGISTIIAWLLIFVPGYLVGQDIWQRALSARSTKIRVTGSRIAAVFIFAFVCCCIFMGMCLAVRGVELENPALAFATSIQTFLPAGLRGLVLCALLAAILSSANGAILGASSVLYNDLFEPFSKKERTDKQKVQVMRILSACIVALVTVVATNVQDLVAGCDLAYAYITGCLFVPMVFGLVLKKVSAKAGLSAIIASFVVTTILIFTLGPTSNVTLLSSVGSNAVVFFTIYLLDKKKHEIDLPEAGDSAAVS